MNEEKKEEFMKKTIHEHVWFEVPPKKKVKLPPIPKQPEIAQPEPPPEFEQLKSASDVLIEVEKWNDYWKRERAYQRQQRAKKRRRLK